MHCRRMHHSLLHRAEGEIANVIIDLAPVADDSEGLKRFFVCRNRYGRKCSSRANESSAYSLHYMN